MVERSDEPRLTTPIVPDSDSELGARHRPSPVRHRRTRTWPLWLACLLLAVGLVTLGAFYWLDRQTWLANQRQLEGQLSNVHARLDGFGDSRDASNTTEQQLTDMQAAQEALQVELTELKTALVSLEESRAGNAALDELAEEVRAVEQQRGTLVATMDAMQRSLNILERSSEDARASLVSRIDGLEATQDEAEQRRQVLSDTDNELSSRLTRFEETQTQLQASIESLSEGPEEETLAAVETRLAELATTLESVEDNDTAQQERLEQLSSSISANQTSLTELRQNQLSLNAIVESLDSQ